jgi:dTDP-4-dehydrorhamnose reductase
MRILILGVSGLIGHRLLLELSSDFEVFGTLHRKKNQYLSLPLFSGNNIIEGVDILDFEILKGIMIAINPDVILNCVGITKRKIEINSTFEPIVINALFPHQLAGWAKENQKRIIHFSTDCVFDGKLGNYNEKSLTTAEDIYGKTKALGEINYSHTLTIRSSFMGQELFDKTELLDWFLAQDGEQINGFKNTFYSGVSTIFMARVVKDIILNFPELSGIYQLAPEKPISKFELLSIAKNAFNVNVDIKPDETHVHLPTLDATKLRSKMNLIVPSWNEMMSELALNKEFYSII